jgi:segregation and condensation protein B
MNERSETNYTDSQMSEPTMRQIIEALLIATDVPLSITRIVELTGASPDDITNHIHKLNEEYAQSHRAFEIKAIAGGYQIYTLPRFADWVGGLHDRKSKLSKAALETIAIVAYHQPITRPEIEKLRGVDSSSVLDTLLQKGLVKTVGRLPVPGRPIKYATTKEFLRYFGITDISDLPREEDFGERVAHTIREENALPEASEENEETTAGEGEEHPSIDLADTV